MDSYSQELDAAVDSLLEQTAETQKLSDEARVAVKAVVRKALLDGDFYRQLSHDMHSGLKLLFDTIRHGPGHTSPVVQASEAEKMFTEATSRIAEVLQTTQQASNSIMEAVEELFDTQEEISSIIASFATNPDVKPDTDKLNSILAVQNERFTNILTECSFEDLTGQRLKAVMQFMESIRETVFELYVASGLMMKGKEQEPDKAPEQIREESKRKIEEIKRAELKGPSLDANQSDVDALLASLGL